MADLADVCVRKGDDVEATKVLRQASDLHVIVFGEEDPGLTRLLRLYGQLYTLNGNYRPAEAVLRRALDIDERASSTMSTSTSPAWLSCAGSSAISPAP